MLSIAVVANNFNDAKMFVQQKFKDKIESYNAAFGFFTLLNGDRLYLCYGENEKDKYTSFEYDAFIVHPRYTTLLDVIKHRSERY